MKTLVIHPNDRSTDFLSKIYENLDCLVVNVPVSDRTLRNLIKEHDKIMMIGHGTPTGLLGYGHYVINSDYVYLLREKPESVYIWCNADMFVERYELKGFYTGMIISEEVEADYCGVPYQAGQVNESNELFSYVVKESLQLPTSKEAAENIKQKYLITNNPIIKYNNNNIYYSI